MCGDIMFQLRVFRRKRAQNVVLHCTRVWRQQEQTEYHFFSAEKEVVR
jgi:hypothetical protein